MQVNSFITRVLRVVGDSTLTVEAQDWLENILYEVMAVGKWTHLQTNTTQATGNDDDTYALPAAYNGYLSITSSASPYEMVKVSKEEGEILKRKGNTGNPTHWWIDGTNYIVWPKPVTGYLPTLNLDYQKIMALPSGSNDIETVTGLSSYWIKYLIDGVVAEGFRYLDDVRQDSSRMKWETNLTLMQKYCSQSLKRGGSRPGRIQGMRGGGLPRGR